MRPNCNHQPKYTFVECCPKIIDDYYFQGKGNASKGHRKVAIHALANGTCSLVVTEIVYSTIEKQTAQYLPTHEDKVSYSSAFMRTYVHVAVPGRDYSVAYVDRVTSFKALQRSTSVKGGVHTCYICKLIRH